MRKLSAASAALTLVFLFISTAFILATDLGVKQVALSLLFLAVSGVFAVLSNRLENER